MAQFMPVFVTALLIYILRYCTAENVYCVKPNVTSCSSCPPKSTHCATLSAYAQETELYFTSNTTMVFLPGDHTLDTNITVANVTRLTMRGESSSGNIATVVCSGSVGLSFTSMIEFKVDSLAFTSCSRKHAITLLDTGVKFLYVAMLLQSTQYAELVNCSFHDNFATALVVNNTNLSLVGNNFTHNRPCGIINAGGAIVVLGSNLRFTGNTTFLDNSATTSESCPQTYNEEVVVGGGVIYASYNTVLNFIGTSNFIGNSAGIGGGGGGAIYASDNTVLRFSGINNFINNSAFSNLGGGGGAIYASDNTVLRFNGTNKFINNSAFFNLGGGGGAIYASDNTVLRFNGTNKFINNSADNGGAIYTDTNNTLIFNGTIYFISNGHYGGGVDTQNGYTQGGGVFMGLKSTFSIFSSTTVYWENNHANLGGAIYVSDASPLSYCTSVATVVPKEECFFQLPGQNLSNGIDAQLIFRNNTADVAGSVLYGGAIDNCKLSHDSHSSGEVFDMLVHIEDNNEIDYNTTSSISSVPFKICPCVNNHSDCDDVFLEFPRTVYPGETFQVFVAVFGQRNGTVPSTVRSMIDQTLSPGDLLESQRLQQARSTCTKFNYTVLSLSEIVSIQLYAEGSPCSGLDFPLEISVNLNPSCPPGFSISDLKQSCVCEQRLAKYTGNCNITNGVGHITRDSGQQFWVGYDNQSHGLILHPHCPLDYCVPRNVTVVFPLTNTDIQCALDRSSLLCGRCKQGYSLVLGTSHCKQCTNNYYLALLILFAVMGVALVFLLLVCKLTVATGTLSGLVFYANIVGVNRTIFLPVESTSAFSIFIAWINLDFGIETCFFNGLDAYSKTWLQLVFPVYIWVIVGLVILISRCSHRFSNLLGNNPVSVLATLILLSYTKILCTSIAAINITYLEYPKYNRKVWLYDANIDYLSGKHIPLFLVAVLVFLFLFLPYTLLLLFGQWLQGISHLRLFSWVNSARLRAFLDSYHAPYKAKHRYWLGLLLVLRFTLLLVFALNLQQDPSINLLAILIGTGMLHFWAWVSGGVYRNWCLDALEGSFALNLIILVGATSYVNHSGGNQLAVGYTSVSIAFVTFIGILAYHIFLQLRYTKLWKKIPKLNLTFTRRNIMQAVNKPADNLAPEADFSKLREPLLEDLPPPNYGAF